LNKSKKRELGGSGEKRTEGGKKQWNTHAVQKNDRKKSGWSAKRARETFYLERGRLEER